MSSSGFRLPCLYCKEETTFESSQLLKEHLLSNHGELVSTGKDGLGSCDRIAKVASRAADPPPLYCKLSEDLQRASSATLFSRKLQQKESIQSPSNIRLVQLNDIISRNGEEWQRLCEANDRRRSVDLREQFHPKSDHSHSRESESPLLTQNTLSTFEQSARVAEDRVFRNNEILHLKLKEFENIISKHNASKSATENISKPEEKRGKRGMLGVESREREMAVGKTQASSNGPIPANSGRITESPLFLKMRTLTASSSSISPETDESRFAEEVKIKAMMKVDDNVLQKETVLGRIEDTSSILPDDSPSENEEMGELKRELEKEKEQNNVLTKSLQDALDENIDMKGEIGKEALRRQRLEEETAEAGSVTAAATAAAITCNKIDDQPSRLLDIGDPEVLSLIRCVEEENQTLSSKLDEADEVKENLLEKVKSLHAEKEKLVENLKTADVALREISNRVSTSVVDSSTEPPRENSKLLDRVNRQLKVNLSQIANMVRQIPTKEQISSRQQVSQLKDELHRITLVLAQEKMAHDHLKKSSAELEETIKMMSDCEDQKDKICTELNLLRTKHKKCVLTESALKQSKREKKTLQKKYENLRRKFDVLNVLDQTIKSGGDNSNTPENVVIDEGSKRKDEIMAQLQDEINEKDQTIREYECDHRSLMEKVESTMDELTKTKEELERIQLLSPGTVDAQNVDELGKCSKLEQDNVQLNARLKQLQEYLALSQNEVETLQGKVNELEIAKLSSESVIASLRASLESKNITKEREMDKPENNKKYSAMVENLTLERDILSSRVLILEGIGDEVEILKVEKEKLKKLNEEMKTKLVESNIMIARTSLNQCDPVSDSLIAVKDFPAAMDKNQKNLKNLNDKDKQRFQMMLSDPQFDPSNSMNYLEEFDLPIIHGDGPIGSTSGSCKELPPDGNTSENEYVQNIHAILDTESEGESTIAYATNQEGNSVERFPTLCEADDGSGADGNERKKTSSKKKKLLGRLKKSKKTKKVKRKEISLPIPIYNNEITPKPETLQATTKGGEKSVDTIKRVKFSVDDAAVHNELIKSYYQECLEREYPILAENSMEQIEHELDDTSCDSPRSTTSGGTASPPLNCSVSPSKSRSHGISYNKSDLGYESHASNISTPLKINGGHLENLVDAAEYEDLCNKFNKIKTKREASEALKILKSLVNKANECSDPDSNNQQSPKKQVKVNNRYLTLKTSKTEALIKELNARFGIEDNVTSTPVSVKDDG